MKPVLCSFIPMIERLKEVLTSVGKKMGVL